MNEIMKLHAHVVYARGKQRQNRRGHETNSVVIVRFGTLTLGSIKLAGRYTEEQGLKEWVKNKSRFTLTKQGEEFLNPSLVA